MISLNFITGKLDTVSFTAFPMAPIQCSEPTGFLPSFIIVKEFAEMKFIAVELTDEIMNWVIKKIFKNVHSSFVRSYIGISSI